MSALRRIFYSAGVVPLLALAASGCVDGAAGPDNGDVASSSEELVSDVAAAKLKRLGPDARVITNRYIVTFHDDMVPRSSSKAAVRDVARSMLAERGIPESAIQHVYSSAISGMAVAMTERQALKLAEDPAVKLIEEDQVMSASVTWGLDRTDQRALPLDNAYAPTWGNGSGVHAYIIDTGIRLTHTEFTGRMGNGYDAVTAGGSANDCNGHGTHVAGTVAGTTYGMAPGATLHPVRVLDCNGSGSTSGVIAGVDWVTSNHVKPAVANMSLGGGASSTLDNAVANSVSAGVTYAVAAGNDNRDACGYSPARVASAITVGSTTNSDARSSFSNFGTCVDVFAPGSSITSAWHTGDSNTNTISGTSMASPHVAGAAALYLGAFSSATPADVVAALRGRATSGRISSVGTGSPNLLLYVGADDGGGGGDEPPPPPPPPPPPGDCPSGYTRYAGSINQGDYLGTAGASTSGTFRATLTGTAPDIDLYLEYQSCFLGYCFWVEAAFSEGLTSTEEINYSSSTRRTYRWALRGFSGSGTYNLCANPAL